MRKRLPLGPVVLDPIGPALADDDRRRLQHPATGGVILFAHNFASSPQLAALTEEIRALRTPELLISVDHEGGRVQRFHDGFTALPPMRAVGTCWERDREAGRGCARAVGTIAAAELAAHGLDFSFAPVLDLDYGSSSVIGDRALHYDPIAVGTLAAEIVKGFAAGGMRAVGKHFPGHGFAALDSHVDVPRDERDVATIMNKDVAPYRAAIEAGLGGIMPAHVVFPQADREPAGYSSYWLQDVLRGKLGFEGLIFSDDLSMAGASTAGGIPERARAALAAGCDMLLLCQNPEAQDKLLESLASVPVSFPERIENMRHRGGRDLRKSVAYREALANLQKIP